LFVRIPLLVTPIYRSPLILTGETFARTLREINFKTAIKLEDAYLQMRREKEVRLKEHFTTHMTDLREMEKLEAAESEKKTRTKSEKMSHSQSGLSVMTGASNSVYSDGYGFEAGSGLDNDSVGGSAVYPGARALGRTRSGGSLNREGSSSSVRTMSPKAKKLMTKTSGRQTAFLIDSLPPNLKPGNRGNSEYNPNASSASLASSAVNGPNSPSHHHMMSPQHAYPHFPNVSNLSVSARIDAFAHSEMFDPKSPTSRPAGAGFGANTNTGTKTTATGAGTLSSAAKAGVLPVGNVTHHVSHRNVIGTTAARGRNSVTFILDHQGPGTGTGTGTAPNSRHNSAHHIAGAMSEQTMVSPLTSGVASAAQLAALSVSALPDYDHKFAKRDAELHLNPRRLLLDIPKSLHLYDQLSAGEQVLAMHKTFHHIGDVVLVSAVLVCCDCFRLGKVAVVYATYCA
jgi:hypothetical protein